MPIDGQGFGTLYFHHRSFVNPPFMNFDVELDWLEQSVPGAISQFQPSFDNWTPCHLTECLSRLTLFESES